MTDGYLFDDGGRVATGRAGFTGDCVTRAIAIASGLPYADVYAAMAAGNKAQRVTKRSGKDKSTANRETAAHGIWTTRKWFKDWMIDHEFVWTPTMLIGQGCKVHLIADELPAGRIICSLSRHYTAMIDGVIHDTFDPRREIWMNVAGPHHPDGDREPIIELGETKNENGVWRLSRRCVYGYWEYLG